MANFFTRALDKLTPWNRGGEVQRNQQAQARKKKKDEEQNNGLSVSVARPNQNIVVGNQPQVQAQRPENLFAGLNNNLKIGLPAPNPVVQAPQPVKKPGFFDKVGHALNIAGQTAVGTVANVPEVGLAAARAGTGIVQGVTQLPHIVTAAAATGTQKLNEIAPNRFTHALNTGAQGANTGVNAATKVVDKPFGVINRGLDRAAAGYERRVPMAAGGAKVYKTEQIPLNVLAGLLTLGGTTAAGEAGQAGRLGEASNAGRFTRFFNKPLTSNPDNIISKTGQAINKGAPVVHAVNSPFRTGRQGITRLINSRTLPTVERGAVDAGEIGNVLTDAQLAELTAPPVQIPVTQTGGGSVPIPVGVPRPPVPIRELGGDTPGRVSIPTAEEAAAQRAASRFEAQAPGRPDQAIEGVTPGTPTRPFVLTPEAAATGQDKIIQDYADMLRGLGEGNGTQLVPDGERYGTGYKRTSNNYRPPGVGSKRMTKQAWRDQAEADLRAGKAEPGHQKAFNDAADPEVQALIAKGEQPAAPEGRPIVVKQATGIPVTDITVPTGLPETPGAVRATTSAAPANAEATAVANAPVVASPAQLPAETQAVLDNPKQYSKRQVAAARNQRKLARQLAKTTEDTAAAANRVETASPAAASGEGFTPTGDFGRSANGGPYQKVSRQAEMQQAVQETSQLSPNDVLQTARKNQLETGGFNRRDIRNVAALFETKRLPRGSAEWNEARAILKEDGTVWGQTGALRNYTMRRTASADELMNRYESKIYRLADDPTKIDGKWFDDVEAAETAYTQARDDALAAYNEFTRNPTSANAKLYHAAQDAAEKADKTAKITEYQVADKALKGNKDVKQARELEKMANEADLYQMDAVDASMLSGTGTFVRNLVNSATSGAEEGLFGGVASRITRLLTRQDIGGGVGRDTISGFGSGARNIVDASKARAGNAGFNPLSHIKNWATTGNQLGDTILDSQAAHNVLDHYTSILKGQGYKGRELTDRASVMARQDPDNLGRMYSGAARTAAGLGGGVTRGNKFETIVKNMISDAISLGKPSKVSEGTAKLITRITIGFPTAIGRSTAEGVKRFTLGAPTFIKALRNPDPVERALLIKEGIKQAGTGGMVLPPLFYAMGANDMITGAYPSDPEERARWTREGITENSVKIGGSYYQLPAYLGAWAVPGLFYASLGRNGGDFGAAATDTAKIVPSLLPTDQASNIMDVINGRTDLGKFMAQTGASAVRATTPGGAALAEVAKMFDPTKNDTTSGTNWENFIDKVQTGVPKASNSVPNKVDDAGNVLQNPNPAPLLFGASSAVQGAGEQRSAQIQGQVDTGVQQLQGLGVLDDPNLKGVLDDKEKLIYDNLKSGKKVGAADLKKLQDAFTKGVSSTGEDTAYLEREQYDTNLAALKLKREQMNADKTVKPSDLKKMDVAIKRGQIYKDQTVPYDMIDSYKTTGIDEWRQMGDPENDNYDPTMYQKLWDIDQMMTKGGVSYKKGALDKNKYYAKEKKAGGKGSRGGSTAYSSDFGTLKGGKFAPSVQQYQTMDQQSGSVPIIRTVRPNIVHKIGSSG